MDFTKVREGGLVMVMAGDAVVEMFTSEELADRWIRDNPAPQPAAELSLAIPGDFDERKHPRWPKGTPAGKGGQFMETMDLLDIVKKTISGTFEFGFNGNRYVARDVTGGRDFPKVRLSKKGDPLGEVYVDRYAASYGEQYMPKRLPDLLAKLEADYERRSTNREKNKAAKDRPITTPGIGPRGEGAVVKLGDLTHNDIFELDGQRYRISINSNVWTFDPLNEKNRRDTSLKAPLAFNPKTGYINALWFDPNAPTFDKQVTVVRYGEGHMKRKTRAHEMAHNRSNAPAAPAARKGLGQAHADVDLYVEDYGDDPQSWARGLKQQWPKLSFELLQREGPGGGNPEYRVVGQRKDVEAFLKSPEMGDGDLLELLRDGPAPSTSDWKRSRRK